MFLRERESEPRSSDESRIGPDLKSSIGTQFSHFEAIKSTFKTLASEMHKIYICSVIQGEIES